jgi:hypothetical protein
MPTEEDEIVLVLIREIWTDKVRSVQPAQPLNQIAETIAESGSQFRLRTYTLEDELLHSAWSHREIGLGRCASSQSIQEHAGTDTEPVWRGRFQNFCLKGGEDPRAEERINPNEIKGRNAAGQSADATSTTAKVPLATDVEAN